MKRQRLSSDKARSKILNAAQKCLIEQGISGLRITHVAKEANIVHSSILHHFGNTEGLKKALTKHLSDKLMSDMTTALNSSGTADNTYDIVKGLYEAFGPGGQANLIAWLVVSGPQDENRLARAQEEQAEQFAPMMQLVRKKLEAIREQDVSQEEASFIIFHVLTAAIGQGMIGKSLSESLNIADKRNDFLLWVTDSINRGIV